jgi:hypothetical protein
LSATSVNCSNKFTIISFFSNIISFLGKLEGGGRLTYDLRPKMLTNLWICPPPRDLKLWSPCEDYC